MNNFPRFVFVLIPHPVPEKQGKIEIIFRPGEKKAGNDLKAKILKNCERCFIRDFNFQEEKRNFCSHSLSWFG